MDTQDAKINSIEIPVTPIGKPRMTQRDKWAKRERVVHYRSFCDLLRLYVKWQLPAETDNLSWIAYFPIPKSWSKKKQAQMVGQLHRQKPDRDNVDKAIMDALLKEDCGVARGSMEKRWDDGNGPRIVLKWEV